MVRTTTGYLFPNDEQENNRLDIFHHICLLLLGGKLHLAPIQHPQRILDVGTGTGIWAIEIGKFINLFVHPTCTFR